MRKCIDYSNRKYIRRLATDGSGRTAYAEDIVRYIMKIIQLLGVKGVKGVALDVATSAAAVANFQQIMMSRFKFMEQQQVL